MNSPTPSSGAAHVDGPQDTPVYRAPIPHVDDTTSPAGERPGRRYVRSEPLNTSPFDRFGGQFGSAGGGTRTASPAFGHATFPFGLGVGARLPRKSLALAALFSLLLGPLGMVYSTLWGAFVMVGAIFWTTILFGHALPFVWLFGVFWAVSAAHRRNRVAAYLEQRLT